MIEPFNEAPVLLRFESNRKIEAVIVIGRVTLLNIQWPKVRLRTARRIGKKI